MRLVHRPDGKPEGGTDRAQHVVRVELGAHELDGDDFRGIELFEEAADNRGLAGSDLTGDDDEALALVHAILQVGERPLVAATAVEERRVGVELEGLARQPVEGFVHGHGYLKV